MLTINFSVFYLPKILVKKKKIPSRYESSPVMMLGRMPTEDKAPVLTENVTREIDLKPIGPKALIPPYSEVRSSTTKTKLI